MLQLRWEKQLLRYTEVSTDSDNQNKLQKVTKTTCDYFGYVTTLNFTWASARHCLQVTEIPWLSDNSSVSSHQRGCVSLLTFTICL